MQGYEVFQPIGFDAFGLPAENYALKTGIHPKDSTEKNIATMEQQLRNMGAMFDWSAEVKTCEEDYYKWTQWLFLQLYKKGLGQVRWIFSQKNTLTAKAVRVYILNISESLTLILYHREQFCSQQCCSLIHGSLFCQSLFR